MAPIAADTSKVSWEEARAVVVDAYSDFSDEAGAIVSRFFDERLDRRAGAAGQAHGRVLRDHRARASTRTSS